MTPAAQAQMITAGEWQVDLIGLMIDDLERDGLSGIDAILEAKQRWANEVHAVSQLTVHRRQCLVQCQERRGQKRWLQAQLCEEAVNQDYASFVRGWANYFSDGTTS